MNICFLTVSNAGEHSGGVEAVCARLMRQFMLDGNRVVHCYYHSLNYTIPNESDACKKYCLPNTIVDSEENVAFFVDIVKDEKIDIVMNETCFVSYHNLCMSAKKQVSFKLVFSYHGDPIAPLFALVDDFQTIDYRYRGFFNRLIRKVYQLLKFPIGILFRYKNIRSRFQKYASETDSLVVLSESYKKRINKILNGRFNNIYCIPNPVVFPDIGGCEKKEQVIFVGRLVRQKRVDRLLRIWREVENEVPDARLLIVGDGEERSSLLRMANDLGLKNCEFLGQKPARNIMAQCKVLTLVSSHEGMGLVALEAMGVGTIPVFYDSLKCLQEHIQNGATGLCVPSFSIKKFAQAIILLLRDTEYADSLSQRGIKALKSDKYISVAEKWYTLYSFLVTKS